MPRVIQDIHFIPSEIETTTTFRKKRKARVPKYHMVCCQANSALCSLNKSANAFFWKFVGLRDIETNKLEYQAKTHKEAIALSRSYKELKKLNLVKRIKPTHYMISPLAVIPNPEEFEKVLSEWEALP